MKRIFIATLLVTVLPSLAYPKSQHEDGRTSAPTTGNHRAVALMEPVLPPGNPPVFARLTNALQSGASTVVRKSGFGFLGGYKFIDIDDHTFRHNTHTDDNFLARAGQPGSAGTTVLKATHWALAGAGYLQKISATSLTLDVGFLVGGDPARRPGHRSSRKKNENDSRPDAQGAFIYSKPTFGLYGAVGYTYEVKKISLGAEGQFSAVVIQAGWDRFGKDQKQSSVTQSIPSLGPKFGFWLDAHTRLEGTVQIGRSVHFGMAMRYTF